MRRGERKSEREKPTYVYVYRMERARKGERAARQKRVDKWLVAGCVV